MSAGYSTREVAKLLKMSERRVRELVRAGVAGSHAGRELRFDFRDVLVLRMAHRLVEHGLPARRVKRALQLLRKQIRDERPLTGVQLFAEGGRVLASDGNSLWEPESGQQHLRFAPADAGDAPAREAVPVEVARPGPLGVAPESGPDHWFDVAMQLEDSAPHKAYGAYLKALEADPEHVEAHINIGRLCSAAGELERAAAYFRQAIRLDPTHPVAHFNLAVTLHDLGELETARDAYRSALAIDESFADAHYNLAAVLEQLGDADGAEEHRRIYQSVRRPAD